MRWMLACLLAFEAMAHADGALPISSFGHGVELPNHVVLEWKNGQPAPWVTRGTLTVPLAVDAPGRDFGGVTHATLDHGIVTVSYSDNCTRETYTIKLPVTAIDARLENGAALALHHAKHFADAAVGFAKAHALDPSWNLPIYNLASAQNLAGKAQDALATLAPLLASDPVGTAVQVRRDPELSSLADAPELRAIRAPHPGTATADTKLAFSSSTQLVAAVLTNACGWSEHSFDVVALRSLDEKISIDLPLGDCNKASPPLRAAANQVLADFGFEPAVDADVKSPQNDKASFPQVKLGVTIGGHANDRHVRIIRGDQVLVEKPAPDDSLVWVAFLPGPKLLVYSWWRKQAEAGCGPPPPYTGLGVLAVP